MSAGPIVAVRALAKINLSLRILRRRPDGYHELRTVFQSLDLHDTVTCIPAAGSFRFVCRSPDVPKDRSNLVWRAAESLWRAAGRGSRPREATVVLEKRIPTGAGLGGGSSDAAAALVGLAKLWRLPVNRSALLGIARSLGADVPFFLVGGTALGRGRGDEVSRLRDRPPRWVVVLRPSFRVSTAAAYAWYASERPPARRMRRSEPINDLEPVVARRRPEVLRMKAALDRSGAERAFMSGSGSAVVGLFRSRDLAARAARTLGRSSWMVILTRTLTHRQHERLAAPRPGARVVD